MRARLLSFSFLVLSVLFLNTRVEAQSESFRLYEQRITAVNGELSRLAGEDIRKSGVPGLIRQRLQEAYRLAFEISNADSSLLNEIERDQLTKRIVSVVGGAIEKFSEPFADQSDTRFLDSYHSQNHWLAKTLNYIGAVVGWYGVSVIRDFGQIPSVILGRGSDFRRSRMLKVSALDLKKAYREAAQKNSERAQNFLKSLQPSLSSTEPLASYRVNQLVLTIHFAIGAFLVLNPPLEYALERNQLSGFLSGAMNFIFIAMPLVWSRYFNSGFGFARSINGLMAEAKIAGEGLLKRAPLGPIRGVAQVLSPTAHCSGRASQFRRSGQPNRSSRR